MGNMQNVKGTFDFFGEEQALRGRVQAVLREVFELYAFTGMETAILNELTLLTSKYAGGDEILKEMYKLSDQGERRLGLRYDLTIPFAKVVALNPGLEFPFRRYEMGKAFRDGPVKRGRLREFVQCDADVVGIAGPEAEAELLLLAAEAFRRLNVPVRIRWNNRRFLGETLAAVGVPADETASVMLTLDKLEKIGAEGVLAELADKGIEPRTIGRIRELLRAENRPGLMERSPGRFERIAHRLDLLASPGAQEVAALQALLERVGLGEDCVFDPFLSRGLSFYTGTVYEIFGASGDFASSLASGGRYDAMIGKLLGRDDLPFPAAGLSFGMESILAILRDSSGRDAARRAAGAGHRDRGRRRRDAPDGRPAAGGRHSRDRRDGRTEAEEGAGGRVGERSPLRDSDRRDGEGARPGRPQGHGRPDGANGGRRGSDSRPCEGPAVTPPWAKIPPHKISAKLGTVPFFLIQ